jgi:hypothetical protein
MFSATKGAGVRKLVTQTFTSNASFVAPGFLTQLETAVGIGSAAVADNPTVGVVAEHRVFAVGTDQTTPPYLLWETIDAGADASAASIAANSGTNLINMNSKYYSVDSADDYGFFTIPDATWIIGSSFTKNIRGSHPTTGNVLYSQLTAGGFIGWTVSANYIALGSAGTATTGFGRTFPGGTLTGTEPFRTTVAPSTTTFTNVAITPGTTYNIVVPSGGSLTITYFV